MKSLVIVRMLSIYDFMCSVFVLIQWIQVNPVPLNRLNINLNLRKTSNLVPWWKPVLYNKDYEDMNATKKMDSDTFMINMPPAAPGCMCGIKKEVRKKGQTFIINGEETGPNEYPWQVAIAEKKSRFNLVCGGSIISSKTILSAAHCFNNIRQEDIVVIIQLHYIKDMHDREKRKNVKQIVYTEPKWNKTTNNNDFAILVLYEELIWSENVLPICLPERTPSSYENIKATVTGFGLNEKNENEDRLMKAELKTMTDDDCRRAVIKINWKLFIITGNIICAFDSVQNPCSGDSGGPLIAKEVGQDYYYVQIGIVSFSFENKEMGNRTGTWVGLKCSTNTKDLPAFFTRVTSQLNWIKMVIKKINGETCPHP